jgi:hypothetical protein
MIEFTSRPYRPNAAMACERCCFGTGVHSDWCGFAAPEDQHVVHYATYSADGKCLESGKVYRRRSDDRPLRVVPSVKAGEHNG